MNFCKRNFKILLILTFCLIAIQSCTVKEKIPEKSTSSEIVHFEYTDEGNIIVPVKINGHSPQKFLFDTGGSASHIDESLVTMFNLYNYTTTYGANTKNPQKITYAGLESLGFNHFSITSTLVFVYKLSNVRSLQMYNIKGILVGDFPKEYILKFDFIGKTIEIWSPESTKFSSSFTQATTGMQRIDLIFHDNIPYFNTNINTLSPILFRIDFGLDRGIYLNENYARKNHLFTKESKQIKMVHTSLAGVIDRIQTRIDSIQIGEYKIPDLISTIAPVMPNDQPFGVETGLIGMAALKRFDLILDFPHSALYLKKNALFSQKEEVFMLGTILNFYEGGTVEINEVLPGTTAMELGLQKGDEIISINNKPVKDIGGDEVNAIFMGYRQHQFTVQVKRKGKIQNYSVQLKPIL